jgi:hypothetical protein
MILNKFVILMAVALLFGCASTRAVNPQRGAVVDGQSQMDAKIAELGASLLQGQGTGKKLRWSSSILRSQCRV